MKNITTVGVDLAKEVIQVCVVTRRKVISNTEMTPQEFRCFLVKTKPCIIVFEACATSNYWKQFSLSQGHDARLLPASALLLASHRPRASSPLSSLYSAGGRVCMVD